MKTKTNKHKFPYEWKLSDGYPAKRIEYHGSKVFSCFACGGGSTMGYKLAGYDVIGMNEIDPKMAECYIENHNPKYAFVEPIQDFKNRKDLPKELYDLEILDGSPPCSSFSMAGNREKDWGKKKKFREGQAKQVLDTLFFDFLDLANELQPKIIIAENVKGILLGRAKEYSKRIVKRYEEIGYKVQNFTLNAARMGVPQRRERVFFIGIRNDLAEQLPQNPSSLFNTFPLLDLVFFEDLIPFGEISDEKGRCITEHKKKAWKHRKIGDRSIADSKSHAGMKVSNMNCQYFYKNKVAPTITAKGYHDTVLFDKPLYVSDEDLKKISTYPIDYDFINNQVGYLCGMSVPPVMTAQISHRIYSQWLSILKPVCDLSYSV